MSRDPGPGPSAPAFDVAILGAGPAGAATALALAGARDGQPALRLALIDRPAPRAGRRSESAAPRLGPLLRHLGLSGDLTAEGHLPCHGTLSLWGTARPHADDFLLRGQGPGWHLDRDRFDLTLRQAARARQVQVITADGPPVLDRIGDGFRIGLTVQGRDRVVTARQLVDASGRSARAASAFGGSRTRLDRLVALGVQAAEAAARGFQAYSLVEAVPYGWWYGARQPGGAASVLLMTDPDLVQAGGLLDPARFQAAWRQTRLLAHHLPPGGAVTPIVTVPAGTQFAAHALGPGWIAVGDALLAFDPLSSAGLAGALADALAAAQVVRARLQGGGASLAEQAYAERFAAMRRRYLTERQAIYARERRWPHQPFWARRHAAAADGVAAAS